MHRYVVTTVRRGRNAVGIGVIALSGCLSPLESDGHDEPDVTGFVIAHGTNRVELGPAGQAGTLTLVAGRPNAVTVRVMGAAGDEPEVSAHPDEFEVEMITPGGVGRFTPAGSGYPYAGDVMPGEALGQAVYFVELHGVNHGHGAEFRTPLVVTIVAPPAD